MQREFALHQEILYYTKSAPHEENVNYARTNLCFTKKQRESVQHRENFTMQTEFVLHEENLYYVKRTSAAQ